MSKKTAQTVAKVIGDALVIDLQTASPRSTWRCSMDKLSHAGFAVKTKGKTHNLLLKTSDKEETIAKFDSLDNAEQTLDTITKALLKPIAVIRTEAVKKTHWFRNFMLIIFIVFLGWMGLKVIRIKSNFQSVATEARTKVYKDYKSPKDIRKGVPLSADEMFGN